MKNGEMPPSQKDAASVAPSGKGLKKEPAAESIIIGVPQGKRGTCSVYLPRISAGDGKKKPSIACMGGRIFVGRHYLEVEPGEKKNEEGQRVAKVTVMRLLELEELEGAPEGEFTGPKIAEVLEIPEGGEKTFSVHGFECGASITRFEREVDPDADTNPHIVIPEKLLSGDEEVCEGMKFRTLNRGDSMELEEGHTLRYFGRIPGGNAFLDIVRRGGKTVDEFEGAEGDSFAVKLPGVEKKFGLRLMKVSGAGGGIDVFWFPKIETEKEGAEEKK
jgi:hypothetical protein